jgi:hypothetical protein
LFFTFQGKGCETNSVLVTLMRVREASFAVGKQEVLHMCAHVHARANACACMRACVGVVARAGAGAGRVLAHV